VWIDELMARDGVDAVAALFSESQGRALVAIPHEEEVKFRGMCEGRGYPVLRIGVTTGIGDDAHLEVQDRFSLPVSELTSASHGTLPARFGEVISADRLVPADDAATARFERAVRPEGVGISE
jgi:phosphoribosylformylglycinamidine (FGAM) synthase-like enzyme